MTTGLRHDRVPRSMEATAATRAPIVAAAVLLALSLAVRSRTAHAQFGTEFTYQGLLKESGLPASGLYDMRFTLWDALSNGTQQPAGNPITVTKTNVTVAAGIFTVALDFTRAPLDWPRYLQIEVRHAGVGNYTLLAPRVNLSPAPFATTLPFPAFLRGDGGGNAVLSATNTTGEGLYGKGGIGVHGESPTGYGGFFISGSNGGVYGKNTFACCEALVFTPGVYGESLNGEGVRGLGYTSGVYGVAGGNGAGYGVRGESGAGDGVRGEGYGSGVVGHNTSGLPGYFFGVSGDGYVGVYGVGVAGASFSLQHNTGVWGSSATGDGVLATSTSGSGVASYSTSGTAVNAQTAASGTGSAVYAYNTGGGRGVWGYSPSGIGLEGQSGSSYGVYGYSSGNYAGYFDGSVYVGGNFVNPSDALLKTGVETLPYGLEDLMRIQPVSWRWADGAAGPRFGVVAQELEKVVPELVFRDCDPERPLAVDYVGLVPVVIRALQEEVREKDAAIRSLEERLRAVEAALRPALR